MQPGIPTAQLDQAPGTIMNVHTDTKHILRIGVQSLGNASV
jgi:hypothetical protein